MPSYIAYYKGKQVKVEASSSYAAQIEAAKMLKAKKSYQVTVVLTNERGQPREDIIRTM
jgi:hypothetical protein